MNPAFLTSEIFGGTIGGLLLMAFAIATVRALLGNTQPWVPAIDVPKAMRQAATEGWPHRALVAFDIAINVIVLRGQQDETISTHSYRASLEKKLWGLVMTWWLNMIQPQHGLRAACGDYERASVRVAVLKSYVKI